MNLKEFIELSIKSLMDEKTVYKENRKLIKSIFEKTNDKLIRLTILDLFYSTQMSKRLYGLNDLATKINEIGNDDDLKKEVKKFKQDKSNKIDNLLKDKYGIYKNGNPAGNARSLISKYIYFATDYSFPIEDTLVKENVNIVLKYFGEEKIDTKKDILKELIKFCDKNHIKYSEFDNLLWLFGKIKKGSLSFVCKEQYESIIKVLNLASSNEFDKKVAEHLKDIEILSRLKDENLISNDFHKFLEFARNIEIGKHNN